MAISVFDLFSIGIGPSSSHTVGPMRAARTFALGLAGDGLLAGTARIRAELFGSLGATGRGHGSDRAVLLGLMGETPETVDTGTARDRTAAVQAAGVIAVLGRHEVALGPDDLVLHRRTALPFHPNGMRFAAFGAAGALLRERTYYSVGGGFVVDEAAAGAAGAASAAAVSAARAAAGATDAAAGAVGADTAPAYPFHTGDQLLEQCRRTGLRISEVMLANELTATPARTEEQVRSGLLRIWAVMQECIDHGLANDGVLPGGLRVPRRAPGLYRRLSGEPLETRAGADDPLQVMDWVNLFALAVNEENAAGGRVVTAPTNGAAGVLPAVLQYYVRFCPGADEDDVVDFLLCAAAIGALYKENASISGAEVGCQGEVGAACSMAAGALCEVLGGTPEQVENAAEIGMEHNLGLTCDPIGGLVQVPCIERNAMGAVKAINAARIAMQGDGRHIVSLDKVIRTMRDTGADMKDKYKETSRGGLAVNVIEC